MARRDGLNIYFETHGEGDAPPVLLVSGLGMQLVDWPSQWLERLVEGGFFVIVFDNRDSGLSSHLTDQPRVDLAAVAAGSRPNVSYQLSDMADDAVAVLDELRIATAHVVGISMGGMIAQQIAIDHPGRVRSLCSIMSTTGDSSVGQPTAEVLGQLLAPPPRTRAEAIDRSIAMSRVIGSPDLPQDEAVMREAAELSYDRSHDADGFARQLVAIVASPDRTGALGNVAVPTVVIHGRADPLVRPDGGEATASAIPGSRLVMIDGMGHDLPPELWDRILEPIIANIERAESGQVELPTS